MLSTSLFNVSGLPIKSYVKPIVPLLFLKNPKDMDADLVCDVNFATVTPVNFAQIAKEKQKKEKQKKEKQKEYGRTYRAKVKAKKANAEQSRINIATEKRYAKCNELTAKAKKDRDAKVADARLKSLAASKKLFEEEQSHKKAENDKCIDSMNAASEIMLIAVKNLQIQLKILKYDCNHSNM